MGVYAKLKRGHDAEYPWRQMGAQAAKTGADYYLAAVAEGGEPQGTWIGEGLAALGIHDGDRVDRDVFKSLYGEFKDPATGEVLGSAPRVNAQLKALFEQMKAAEPGLTRAREHELWLEARAQVKSTGVMYWDGTFNVDKSLGMAHATALASAMEARDAGDEAEAAVWAERAAGVWEEILTGVRAYIDHIQREAGYVRTGHHGRKGPDGESTGRRERAYDIPVAIFPQHISRDGDIHLHVHVLFLNKVMTISDGLWRAPDSRAMHRVIGAACAIGALVMESGAAARYGFNWVWRPGSKGRVIDGTPDKAITAFSSRTTAIDGIVAGLAAEFERQHGRAPNRAELYSLDQKAGKLTRRGKEDGALDFRKLLREWAQTAREAQLGSLLELRSLLWRNAERGLSRAEPGLSRAEPGQAQVEPGQAQVEPGQAQVEPGLSLAQERAVMAEGLALAQQGGSSWTKRSLIHRLAAALPDRFVLPPGADADVFLTGLADRVIVGAAGEQVVCLSAPEYPRVPDSLRRADGESVYHAHGSELYATAAQMSLEDRVVAMAQAPGAPRLAPDVCAKLLGAAEPELEAQLRAAAPGSGSVTGSGLRLDQAAAAFHALTSPRRTEVIVAAAGAGKTYTAGVMARAWAASGTGRVFGVATSSAARNELADAGVPDCYNFAQFLGHTKERREALRKVDIGAGDLILVDEGTMASLPDFDALQRYATARGAAVRMFAGDQQLGAVEGVSAAGLLARSGQYARLQEPVRFAPGWERDASLALKDGDVSCLQAYEDHGRLHGGTYEEMAEQAARMYMADMAEDVETSLNAYSHAEVQDLNRRVQAYMREYRLAGRGPSVQLRDGTRAAAGELVLARENDNRTSADGDRTVSNGDILRVYEIRGGRVTVRRLTGHDKQTGRRTWSDPYALTAKYLREHAELGYAQTTHTAEGATTWSGILLTSNTRTRTSLYPGLTRGRHRNHAFAYPAEPDCEAGKESQAAPEVARYQAMAAERDGAVRMAGESEHDPVVLLAPVISRDDTDLGATEIRQKALADADHMATLWQIRQDLARRSSAARYEAVVRERFSADQAAEIIADTDDLWRALRGAELAGVTPSDALSAAVAQRSMGDAESVPAVLTYRVRKLTEHLTPADPRRQPEGDGEAGECMRLVDTLLDGRQERIAEHTAKIAPGWAVAALGPVPETEEDRREWEAAAGVLGGYREIRTFDSPVSAIGPRPPTTEPEMRAEWHKAHAVITHAEEMRLRDLTEGQLLARRTAGLRDTTWAPPEVTREMGVAHSTETEYRIAAAHHLLRSRAPLGAGAAAIARAGRHLAAAQEAQAAAARCQDVAQVLAAAHATRQQYNALHAPGWAEATEADRELHRRGLLAPGDVLRSQERPAFDYAAQRASAAQVETGQPVQGELDLGGQAATPPAKAEAAVPSADDVRVMLGIDPARVLDGGTDALEQMKAATAAAQEKIDREATILEPDAQDEDLTPAQAWSRETGRERQSVLHTPDPEMPVAPQIAAAAVERDREATS